MESASEKSSIDGDGSVSDNKEPDSNDADVNLDNGEDNNGGSLADAKYGRLKSLGDKDHEVQYLFCFVNIF